VDYAALQRTELRTLVEQTLSRRRGRKTRLVALTRGRGAWWQHLTRTPHGIGDFLSGPATSVMALTPVAGTPKERLDSFQRAAKSFAQPATATAAVAEMLHTLYPGDGWLEGVQPDLLGEHLLYRAGQEDPAILRVFDVP